MSKRRKYSAEFKREAVQLVAMPDVSLRQVAKDLGGWSTMVMVQRYAHLGGDHLKRAADRINGTISSHATKERKLHLVVSH
jgi:transposase-like protein